MLVLPLLFFYFVQLTCAQQQYGAGLFSNLLSFQRKCLCRCGIPRQSSGWFSDDDPISASQFPWLVTVKAGDQAIAGTLISDRHVITAAYPLYNLPASNISVIIGARDRCDTGDAGLATGIESVLPNPGFSPTNRDSDIAIITLRYIVPFNDFISPACMPFNSWRSREQGQVAYTVSWTDNSGNISCTPRVVSLPVLSGRVCLMSAGNTSLVTGDKGCLGPAGSTTVICQEDVGAPVLTQRRSGRSFYLVGIISSSDCDSVTTPLYTRVAQHEDWIKAQTRSSCQCFSRH